MSLLYSFLKKYVEQDTKIVVEVRWGYVGILAKNGIGTEPGSFRETLTIPKWVENFSFDIYWTESEVKDASITVYFESTPTKKTVYDKIEITAGSSGASTYLENVLKGPSYGVTGSNVTLGYATLENAYRIKWTYDGARFKEISRYHRNITLQPKQVIGEKEASVTMEVEEEEWIIFPIKKIWIKVYTHTWKFPVHGIPFIVNEDNVVCAGNTTRFKVQNYSSVIDSIRVSKVEWVSGTGMAFSSGQNQEYGTFRASGNGNGSVKAIITQKNGRTYNIENKDTWVGAPTTPSINGLKTTGDYQSNIDYPLSGVHVESQRAVTNYIWGVQGGASIIVNPSIRSAAMLKISNIFPKKTDSFSLFLSAQNKCGTSLRVTHNGKISGGDLPSLPGIDPQPMSIGVKSASTDQATSIRIYTFTTGALVYHNKNATNFNIEQTTLNKGIYIVETTDENGTVTRSKVMKR